MDNEELSLADSDAPTLLAVIYKCGDWIITLLQIYILINAAFIGWIFTKQNVWSCPQKFLVFTVYFTAIATNFVWMFRLRWWLLKIVRQIEKIPIFANPNFSEVKDVIEKVQKNFFWRMLFGFHLLSDIAVSISIFINWNH